MQTRARSAAAATPAKPVASASAPKTPATAAKSAKKKPAATPAAPTEEETKPATTATKKKPAAAATPASKKPRVSAAKNKKKAEVEETNEDDDDEESWAKSVPPPALEEEKKEAKPAPAKKARLSAAAAAPAAAAAAARAPTAAPTVKPGTIVTGRIEFAPPPKFKTPLGSVLVQFSTPEHAHVYGKVDICDLFDEPKDQPLSLLKNGQFVKCIVLKPAPATQTAAAAARSSAGGGLIKFVELSMRASLVKSGEVDREYEQAFELAPKIKDGTLHAGYVVSSNKLGCFVRVSRALTARVMLKCLANTFINKVEAAFPFGMLVRGAFTSMTTEGKVEMDLRAAADSRKQTGAEFTAADMTTGAVVRGVVEKVINAGVLVKLGSSNGAVGLCHYTECFDEVPVEIANSKKKIEHGQMGLAYRPLLDQHFKAGDRVKCIVLKADQDSRKISLGMKPQYFADIKHGEEEEEEEQKAADVVEDEEDEDEDEDEQEDAAESYRVAEAKPTMSLQQAMKDMGVKAPAVKSAAAARGDEDNEDSDDDEAASGEDAGERATRTLNSKRRDALKRKAEQATALLEDRIVQDAAPNSVDEFERALVSNKTSSLLWIQYISFLVSIGEPIAKARQVAKRALDSIGPMIETEFQNVFSAWLTLELAFGQPQGETYLPVFQDMVKRCDEEWAHLTLCNALIASKLEDKKQRVEEAFKRAKRATKQQSGKVWQREFEYYFDDVNNANQARTAFKEAIRLANKKDKQIELMLAFARLEFQHEPSSDRGPQIFEKLLETYPKRVDFWNVYIDLQVKHGALDTARALFSRVLLLKLSPKKMKSFFKKWLEMETEHGSEAQVELVKQKARDYVEQL